MSKYIKEMLVKELQGKFTDVNEFIIVDMTGVGGIENNLLRGELGQKGIKIMMVKNAAMRQALKELDMAPAVDLFTAGPCTVVYGSDSVVDVAKEFKAATDGKVKIKFRGAYTDGAALDEAAAANLVNMKSRVELLGDIVMLANSPARRLAGAIAAPGGIIAGCLKTIAEGQEKEAA
ncbi:MAG: 50S ribosomal protein L10 [Sedimentisphaerales bacterium]|nr:50S ribosomal protein L10 [Sedimentisphaerales bacterium]